MDDTISRQESLDHLRKRLIEAESKFNCDAGMVFEDITQNRLKTWLEELPSAQQWIPCSERLPEEKGYYLTTTMYQIVYCDYWNGEHFDRTETILAWMPLPEPWKEEE